MEWNKKGNYKPKLLHVTEITSATSRKQMQTYLSKFGAEETIRSWNWDDREVRLWNGHGAWDCKWLLSAGYNWRIHAQLQCLSSSTSCKKTHFWLNIPWMFHNTWIIIAILRKCQLLRPADWEITQWLGSKSRPSPAHLHNHLATCILFQLNFHINN